LNFIVPEVSPRSIVTVQTNGVLKLNFGWLPSDAQNALGAFARTRLALELYDGWEARWPEVGADTWVGSAEALVAFLEGLRPMAKD
jgi:hypothetical protein